MALSIEEVAARIRHAYAEGPIAGAEVHRELAGDTVEVQHVPPREGDGAYEGRAWATELIDTVKALERKIPDFLYRVDVSIDNDQVQVIHMLSGTLPNGGPLDRRIRSLLTVTEGKIVKGTSYREADSDDAQRFLKGLRTPRRS